MSGEGHHHPHHHGHHQEHGAHNIEEMTNQGEFHPGVNRSEPMEKGGHQPGVHSRPADNAPEFHAEEFPRGTAPAGSTFEPNPTGEVPSIPASATLGGATSADVYKGLGKPPLGQSSVEKHHEGRQHRKHEHSGLEGVGAAVDEEDNENRVMRDQMREMRG
ncbi:hypothetical protein AJ80_03225 [Polytolypa hystricis UAMH7299]|uniref:Uncharacterized protein n=1 Tax=Polytolypa hystricis (strain UAMH7299) TaxID=1447883 RepID=A0A2B7YBJ3_POLH7|nr:hypothetical protein AJ80_03225 [Polytolypa hystricis UAMH7299]